MPKSQTIATDKWQKKAGYITKGFKIKKELADDFKKICDSKGVSQASVISGLMEQFIRENK